MMIWYYLKIRVKNVKVNLQYWTELHYILIQNIISS